MPPALQTPVHYAVGSIPLGMPLLVDTLLYGNIVGCPRVSGLFRQLDTLDALILYTFLYRNIAGWPRVSSLSCSLVSSGSRGCWQHPLLGMLPRTFYFFHRPFARLGTPFPPWNASHYLFSATLARVNMGY